MSCFLLSDRDFDKFSCLTFHKVETALNDPSTGTNTAATHKKSDSTKCRATKKSIWKLTRKNKNRDGHDRSDDIPQIDIEMFQKLANGKSELILNRSLTTNEKLLVEKLHAVLHGDSPLPTIACQNRASCYNHCCEEYPPACLPSPCVKNDELHPKKHSIINFLKELGTGFSIPDDEDEEEDDDDDDDKGFAAKMNVNTETTSTRTGHEIQAQESSSDSILISRKDLDMEGERLYPENQDNVQEGGASSRKKDAWASHSVEKPWNDIYNNPLDFYETDNGFHYFEPLNSRNAHHGDKFCVVRGDRIIEVEPSDKNRGRRSSMSTPRHSTEGGESIPWNCKPNRKVTSQSHHHEWPIEYRDRGPQRFHPPPSPPHQQMGQIEKVELWMRQQSKFLRVSSTKTLESTAVWKEHVEVQTTLKGEEHHAQPPVSAGYYPPQRADPSREKMDGSRAPRITHGGGSPHYSSGRKQVCNGKTPYSNTLYTSHSVHHAANPYGTNPYFSQSHAQFYGDEGELHSTDPPRWCASAERTIDGAPLFINKPSSSSSPIWERRGVRNPPSPLQLPLRMRKRMNSI